MKLVNKIYIYNPPPPSHTQVDGGVTPKGQSAPARFIRLSRGRKGGGGGYGPLKRGTGKGKGGGSQCDH